jgi:DNA-binding XRE family transcriptional regulator
MKTIKAADIHARRMADDPDYREAYEALGQEFSLVSSLIEARLHAHLTQAEIASRMGTTESAVSRLESGRVKPSTRTLERYAKATGHRLSIRLEPEPHGRPFTAAM